MRTVQNIMPRENVPEAHLEPFCDRRPEESLDKLCTLRVLAAAVLFTAALTIPKPSPPMSARLQILPKLFFYLHISYHVY